MAKLIQKSNNRQELFDNTIKFFNTKNRSHGGGDSRCKYRGANNTACAIGREIPDELAKSLDRSFQNAVKADSVFDKLPKRLQRMGKDFLNAIQRLHDTSYCWDETGLTPNGVIDAKNIAKDYKLNTKVLDTLTK
jgi:hypothetical protein